MSQFNEDKTLFTRIIERHIPADIVYEDELCIAIKDIMPQAPVHVLLIPKKVIPKLNEMIDEDAALMGHLMTRIPQITLSLSLSDYRVVINHGASAGQTVFHLHIHILGGRDFQWPPG